MRLPYPTSPLAAITGVAPPEFDSYNTVAQIIVEKAPPGVYSIMVLALNTPFPAQGYALCVYGELSSALEPVT
jgi:hypothetical protein